MNTRKGFTLVELLVVIAILAILATVSVVGYTSFINRANESNAQTEAHQIETAIESYLVSGQPYVLGTTADSKTVYIVKLTSGVVISTDKTGATGVLTDLTGITLNDDIKGLGTLAYKSAGVLTFTSTNVKVSVDIDLTK